GCAAFAAVLVYEAGLALREPVQVFLEPLAYGSLILRIPDPGLRKKLHTLNGADQNAAFDDSLTGLAEVGNCLRIFQAGIHARLRIDEPDMDDASGALGILRVIQEKGRGP